MKCFPHTPLRAYLDTASPHFPHRIACSHKALLAGSISLRGSIVKCKSGFFDLVTCKLNNPVAFQHVLFSPMCGRGRWEFLLMRWISTRSMLKGLEPFPLERTLLFQKGFFRWKGFMVEPYPSANNPLEQFFVSVVFLSNAARGGVVYGQYTTAKGCS